VLRARIACVCSVTCVLFRRPLLQRHLPFGQVADLEVLWTYSHVAPVTGCTYPFR
jgi:hypothetical protein